MGLEYIALRLIDISVVTLFQEKINNHQWSHAQYLENLDQFAIYHKASLLLKLSAPIQTLSLEGHLRLAHYLIRLDEDY